MEQRVLADILDREEESKRERLEKRDICNGDICNWTTCSGQHLVDNM